jgi:hypothetical protein
MAQQTLALTQILWLLLGKINLLRIYWVSSPERGKQYLSLTLTSKTE